MTLPDKLAPIPGLDRSILPSWIEDVGLAPDMDGLDRDVAVMTARGPEGVIYHVDFMLDGPFDETFWVRYAEPAVNCLGAALFEAEHPGMTERSFHWDAARFYGDTLTDEQVAIIARRKELTWTSPIRVLPD